MPQSDSTRRTESSLRPAFCRAATINTDVFMTGGKIYPMMLTMTNNTKGQPIRYIKSILREFGPFFNMVSMNSPRCTANLAAIPVSFIHCGTPSRQFITQPRPVSCETITVFPCGGIRSDHVFDSTFLRTVGFPVTGCRSKLATAIQTFTDFCSPAPTPSTAELRRRRPVWMLFIITSANRTLKKYLWRIFSHTPNIT